MSGSLKERIVGFFITPATPSESTLGVAEVPLATSEEAHEVASKEHAAANVSHGLQPSIAVFADPGTALFSGFALALAQIRRLKSEQTAVVIFLGRKEKVRSLWATRKAKLLARKLCSASCQAVAVGRCVAVSFADHSVATCEQVQSIMAENYAPTVIVLSCVRDRAVDDLLAVQDQVFLVADQYAQASRYSSSASLSERMAQVAQEELAETYYGRVGVKRFLLSGEGVGAILVRLGLAGGSDLADRLWIDDKKRR